MRVRSGFGVDVYERDACAACFDRLDALGFFEDVLGRFGVREGVLQVGF